MLAENSKYLTESKNYSVTEDGRIYSHSRVDRTGRLHKGRWIKLTVSQDGYYKVVLHLGQRGKSITRRVCRLVAEAFIPNPENKPCVNHLDGDKLNDSVNNLEWCTHKENTVHAWKEGLCKPYDRTKPYNRQAIVDSNKRRSKVCGL